MVPLIDLISRILLSAMFLLSGIGKIGGYAATQGYMASKGVPGELLPLVILLEIAAPILVIVGWHTRIAAAALTGFTLIAAVLFHSNFAEPMQNILFMKDLAVAGGLLLLTARGAGEWSLDARNHSA